MTAADCYRQYPELLGHLNTLGPLWLRLDPDENSVHNVQFALPNGIELPEEDPTATDHEPVKFLQIHCTQAFPAFSLNWADQAGFRFVRAEAGENYTTIVTLSLPLPNSL